MKKLLFPLIIMVCLGIILFGSKIHRSEDEKPVAVNNYSSPTEQFIKNYLIADDGTIITDFADHEQGSIKLSESMGLWLEYLAEKDEDILFDKAFEAIQHTFITEHQLISWKVDQDGAADTNALIDDLRIIEALFKKGERDDNPKYLMAAKMMSEAVVEFNMNGDMFIDFYDVKHEYGNKELTLSYIIPGALQYMNKYRILPARSLDKLTSFMDELPLDNGFYPKFYDLNEQSFHFDETINLIDQLYVVLHLERFGIDTQEFYTWLKEEFYKENILYGRYERNTKKQSVDYEAASVYSLAILYSIEKRDEQFSLDLYNQMMKMRIIDKESSYFGGYIDTSTESTHSFDNLLPLLAEEKYMNEKFN